MKDNDSAAQSIQFSKGVGPQRTELFARIGIKTIKDAFYYLPHRYENRSNLKKIGEILIGRNETVRGRIVSAQLIKPRKSRLNIFELTIHDGTGFLKGKWFNQPYMKKNLKIGQEIILSGYVKRTVFSRGDIEMDTPEYEIVTEDSDSCIHTKRVVPIYRLTEGISAKQFRKIMFNVVNSHIDSFVDPIPSVIIQRNHLPALKQSIRHVHFPEDDFDQDSFDSRTSVYHKRLAFDELFLFELGLAVLKKNARRGKGRVFDCKGDLRKALLSRLPFALTEAQKRVVDHIIGDMRQPYSMQRLIQGDVGCGKTVVALLAMLCAVECGFQAALMAPTEILAEQHYLNIYRLVETLGLTSELLTGSTGKSRLNGVARGDIPIVIGTHALIQEGVTFMNLGLVVIDEQHKFGVMQRALLRKKGMDPDVLVMTATPIPRSLALTLYGDLDSSIIDELPPNRQPVITKLFNIRNKAVIYKVLHEEIKRGRQAYVVYPAIEESEIVNIRSAVKGKEAFEKIFPEFRVALLHGRMNPEERETIMRSFKDGGVDILVCTTVIEVGVDVPNATIMLIIHAERYGLAQLHQLRGRVGRGSEKSYCLLLAYEPLGEEAKQRLHIMVQTSDGFKIAEEDLSIRGPGEFLGSKQSGMPDFRVADIVRDAELLETARKEAFNLVESNPELEEFPSLRRSVELFWKGKVDFFRTG